MPTWCNKSNMYMFGWCLYYLQGILYPVGSFCSQLVLAILLLVSLYHFFILNVRYKLPPFFIGLNLLNALFALYGILSILIPEEKKSLIPSYYYIKNVWISLLPIYSFYFFSKENIFSEKKIYFWIFSFFATAIGQYVANYNAYVASVFLNKSETIGFTNNMGYLFLALIPASMFFYRNFIIQYVFIGLNLFFIVMAAKRGAIIISFFCLIWFLWNNIKNENVKKKINLILISFIFCCIAVFFVQKYYSENFYFRLRVEQTLGGDSSGRDEIYSSMIDFFWNKTNPFTFIWGYGADGTLKIYGDYAHNDWVEIAINQGIVGILTYVLYWFLFAKECVSRFYGPREKLALQLLFIIYFMKSIFSMSYYDMPISATFILGYCLAQEKKNEQTIYSN